MDKHAKPRQHQAARGARPDQPVITGRLHPPTGKKLARDSSFTSLQLTGKGRAARTTRQRLIASAATGDNR